MIHTKSEQERNGGQQSPTAYHPDTGHSDQHDGCNMSDSPLKYRQTLPSLS